MTRREFKGAATATTLVVGITDTSLSLSLAAVVGWPTTVFTMVVDPGLLGEEKLLCASQVGGTVIITSRGYDNTTATAHAAGAICYPVPTAVDFDEANSHVNASTGVHGIAGAVVGTTDTQTVSNKNFTSGTNTFPASLADLTSAQTSTNKTFTDPKINIAFDNQVGTAYTLVLTDNNMFVSLANASPIVLTVPPNIFPVGAQITIEQGGAGQVTFTPGAGVTINGTGTKLRLQWSQATLTHKGSNVWSLGGDIQ